MKLRPECEAQVVLAGLLFVMSGAAALIYQVAWQRILVLHSGVGLYSVTVIVAAFLAGLGLGNHLGGVMSARVGGAGALRAFAWLEIGIGVLGAASPIVYVDWLYPVASPLPSPSWQAGLLHFAALMPPTAAMGASLPFLVRATVWNVEAAGRTVGLLYGFNMLGAAVAAAGATWWLMPIMGIRGAVAVAAVLNVAVGCGAWWLLKVPEGVDEAVASGGASMPAPSGRPLGAWLLLYALSGFTALSLEILWFRLVDVAVNPNPTFGSRLSALGSRQIAPQSCA